VGNQGKRTREHYIHRLSYTAQERIVGSFVLVAVALLVWLLITSQKAQNIFEDEITLYGRMSQIQAVDEDTNVVISGLNVGSVTEVNIDDKNNAVITMSILKKYQKLIRTNSVAEVLNFKFALLGKSVIEISIGSPSLPVIKDGSTLEIQESLNLVKLVGKVEPVLATIQNTINNINDIIESIKPETIHTNINNIESISNDLKNISEQISKGRGTIGRAVYSQQMEQDIKASITNLRKITEDTRTMLVQTQKLLKTLQTQADEIPEITGKVKPLIDEADKTIRATQQIWPLSGSIPEDNRQTLIPPGSSE
jgi:phospholipid/cholesterol/gamma-HCH transport system substrate-binding protein